MEETRDVKLEKVRSIPIEQIEDVPEHPFKIQDFVEICKNETNITVDTVYYHFLSLTDSLYATLARSDLEASLWMEVKEWDVQHHTHKLSVGESPRSLSEIKLPARRESPEYARSDHPKLL